MQTDKKKPSAFTRGERASAMTPFGQQRAPVYCEIWPDAISSKRGPVPVGGLIPRQHRAHTQGRTVCCYNKRKKKYSAVRFSEDFKFFVMWNYAKFCC